MNESTNVTSPGDAYFSADVETDGPIPGPYSMLSFALVYVGRFDGHEFKRNSAELAPYYRELKPISDRFQQEALDINGLDRSMLLKRGGDPRATMTEAAQWVRKLAAQFTPVFVAYPMSFDWTWLYWYFTEYSETGSPFGYSHCYDIKTAFAVKSGIPISQAGRSRLHHWLRSTRSHTHHAIDDASEQAEIFANVFEWRGQDESHRAKKKLHK